MRWSECPDCQAAFDEPGSACHECGLPLVGRLADRLYTTEVSIVTLDARRGRLEAQRGRLVDLLRQRRAEQREREHQPEPQEQLEPATVVARPALPAAPVGTRPASAGQATDEVGSGPLRDLSRNAVRNVLLLVGGVLLGIAAIVFTVVSWGHLSIRAAILVVLTAAMLAVPWPLVRRRLEATAETIALIGLVLVPLCVLAISKAMQGYEPTPEEHQESGVAPDSGMYWWAAVGSALLAAGWEGYARIAPLRLPRPTAIVLAQFPLPFVALAIGPTPTGVAFALLGTALFDLSVWRGLAGPRGRLEPELGRGVAVVAGGLLGLGGSGTALVSSFLAVTPGDALRVSGVLGFAALLAGAWALYVPDDAIRVLVSGLSGVTATVALATPAATVLPWRWAVAAYAWAACAVLGGTLLARKVRPARRLPLRLRQGVGWAAAGVLAAAALWVGPDVLLAVTDPFGRDGVVYGPDGWSRALAGPVVMLALATVTGVVSFLRATPVPALRPRLVRTYSRAAAVVFAGLAVLQVPVLAGLPDVVALTVVLVLAAVALAIGAFARGEPVPPAAIGVGGCAVMMAASWSRVDNTLRVTSAVVVLVLLVACAVVSRTTFARAASGAGAVLSAGWLGYAVHDAERLALDRLPFVLLGMCALVVLLTLPVPRPRVLARAVVRARGTPRAIVLGVVFVAFRALFPGVALRSRRPAQVLALDAAAMVLALCAVALCVPGLAAVPFPLDAGQRALTFGIAAVLAVGSAWVRQGTGQGTGQGMWRKVALGEAYLFAALAPLPFHDAFVPALFGPYGWLTDAWTGASYTAREALSPHGGWIDRPLLVPVLLIAALAVVLAAAVHKGRWAALGVARVAVPIALAPLPLAANLPYWAALTFLVVLTAGLAIWAAASQSPVGGTALWTATLALAWSLADQTATLAVLAALAIAGLACAVRGRNSPVASVASAVTALAVGAEGAAVALAGGLPGRYAAFVVLAIAMLAVRASVVLRARPFEAAALRAAALVLWCCAVGMTFGHPDQFTLVLAIGGLTAVLAAAQLTGRARMVVLCGGWLVEGCALALHVSTLAVAWLGPYGAVGQAWSFAGGGWSFVGGTVRDSLALSTAATVPLSTVPLSAAGVTAIAAGAAIASARLLGGMSRAYQAATVAVPAALLLIPVTVNLPYVVGLALVAGLVCALAVRAVLSRTADLVAGGMALWLATLLIAWSLLTEPTTLLVTGGLATAAAIVVLAARSEPIRAGAGAASTLAFGGFAAAAGLADGWPVEHTAFLLLGVAAASAVLASNLLASNPVLDRRRTGLAIEFTGYVVGGVGVLMTVGSAPLASLALASMGVLALAVALRPDRRRAVWVGLALLQLALWIRLAWAGVTAPEAYTVSVTVAGLVGGWWARKRRTNLSSWTAYGAALALTFGPSLTVAWNDPGLARPWLLGLAAFVTTLAGAWVRLQAPLLVGGAVLVVNAAHELAPAFMLLVGEAPRWLPIALTGTALLFAGATYEHRLRDLRRVRDSIAQMR